MRRLKKVNKNQVLNDIMFILDNKNFNIVDKENVVESFEIMKTDISKLENNEEYTSKDDDHSKIFTSIDSILHCINNDPITPELNTFSILWCRLVINWNNNTIRKEILGKNCMFIIRLLDQHYTIIESIEIMKMLNKRLRDFKNWNPLAFEISKDVLNYLD